MNDPASPRRPCAAISRRQFLGGAGAFAGLAGLLPSTALAAITSDRYLQALVFLEGNGLRLAQVVDARGADYVVAYADAGQDSFGAAALAPRGSSIRPLRLAIRQFTPALVDWLVGAYSKGARLNGALIVADGTGRELFRQQLDRAYLTGIELESLDAGAQENLDVTLELTPLATKYTPGSGAVTGLTSSTKTKALLRSNFRLVVQGAEAAAPFMAKVGSIATRRTLTVDASGQVLLSPWASPAFGIELRRAEAAPFFDWQSQYINGKPQLRSAVLQLLSPDLTSVFASVQFSSLGLLRGGLPGAYLTEFELQPTGAVGWDFKPLVS